MINGELLISGNQLRTLELLKKPVSWKILKCRQVFGSQVLSVETQPSEGREVSEY